MTKVDFYTTLSFLQQNLININPPKKPFICIPTTPLATRQSHIMLISNRNDIMIIEVGSEIGHFCNNARISLNLP